MAIERSELKAAGLLTSLDLDTLARLCKWHEIKVKVSRQMDLDHLGSAQTTTLMNYYSMASKALRHWGKIRNDSGWRSRVKVVNPKQEDLFGKFLNGFADLDEPNATYELYEDAKDRSANSTGVGDQPPGDERLIESVQTSAKKEMTNSRND